MSWLTAFVSFVLLFPCFDNQQPTAGPSNATERSVSQVLNPPSFNLAEGRRITASATCGEGVDEPEMYCKLVGANWADSPNKHIFQGQACDYCDPNNASLSHKAEYAIDGTERWWQSPPLSRGVKYNEVNVTIDLGQVCCIQFPMSTFRLLPFDLFAAFCFVLFGTRASLPDSAVDQKSRKILQPGYKHPLLANVFREK